MPSEVVGQRSLPLSPPGSRVDQSGLPAVPATHPHLNTHDDEVSQQQLVDQGIADTQFLVHPGLTRVLGRERSMYPPAGNGRWWFLADVTIDHPRLGMKYRPLPDKTGCKPARVRPMGRRIRTAGTGAGVDVQKRGHMLSGSIQMNRN